jgi:hypothetical protein
MKDDRKVTLTDGREPYEGYKEIKDNGQQRDYLVLSEEERGKGFIRPVRRSYIHVGIRPTYPTRDLTSEEQTLYKNYGYTKREDSPDGTYSRFWTEEQLKSGCKSITTMSLPLAETYARDPFFYGATFCSTCGKHFPVGPKGEFVWVRERTTDPENQKVGT